ncbi:MAG: O-antigen ligase family protein [Flavobacteriales bacterium]|nr:O-antigen ligase family protein [Flavobacteriales bacterium]
MLFSGIALVHSVNAAEGLFDFLRVGLIFLFWAVSVMILAEVKEARKWVAWCLVLGGFIMLVWGIKDLLQWRLDPDRPLFRRGRISGSMANRNLFSSYLFLSLPFAFWLLSSVSLARKRLLVTYVVLAIAMAMLIQTRSVQLGMLIGLAVVGLCLLIRRKNIQVLQQHFKWGLVLIWAVLVIPVAINPGIIRNGLESASTELRADKINEMAQSSVNKRIHMWYHTSRMIEESPWQGKGLASWKILLPTYGHVSEEGQQGLRFAQRPHNDFLWVLSETGFGGYMAFLALFLLTLGFMIKGYFTTGDRRMLGWIFALTGYLVIASFSFPKERILLQVILMLIMAYGVVESESTKRMMRLPKTVMMILVAIVTWGSTYTAWVSWKRIEGEALTAEVYRQDAKNNNRGVVKAAELATNKYFNIDNASTPIPWYAGVGLYEQGKPEEAIEAFERGLEFNPYHIRTLNNLGSAYVQIGDNENAIRVYKEGLVLSPRYTQIICNLSAVYYNLGRNEEAYETILTCPAQNDHLLPPTYEPFALAILKRKFAQMKEEEYPAVSHHMMDSLLTRTDYLIDTFRDAANANEDFIEHLRKKDRFRN